MKFHQFVRSLAAATCVAALILGAVSASAEVKAGWKGSLFIEDDEAGYRIKVGGRIMNDWIWTDLDSVGDGTIFRRARLYSSGDIYHNVFYKIQFDFAGGDADFKDVFIGMKDLPVVSSVLVGHQYEPAGLETITSSKYITFMERASVSTLMPERKTGVAMFREWPDDRFTFAFGSFQNSNDFGDAKQNGYALTGRLTWAPTNVDAGRRLLHFGASGSLRKTENGMFQQNARPENPFGPPLGTDVIFADQINLFGGEFIANRGSLSIQSEVAFVSIDSDSIGTPVISSWYVQTSYFLTGEHRGYKHGKGDAVKVLNSFDGSGGRGAWEIAGRYSTMDMNDDPLQAGEFNVATAGVNWYINPYTRIMFDYSYTDYTDVGKLHAFGTRFQIAF